MKTSNKNKKRIYFDYNIYESISKGRIIYERELFDKCDVYISVAHIEEYFKAQKNDINNENSVLLENLKNTIMGIRKKEIILNPDVKNGIKEKIQSFEGCLRIVETCDTRELVERNGEILDKNNKEEVNKLRKENKEAIYYSSLDKQKIWDEAELARKVKIFPEYLKYRNQIGMHSLISIYGIKDAEEIWKKQKISNDFKLSLNCFAEGFPSFSTLECVIEFLNGILNECGYHRDKGVRKSQSGIHDVSHAIYGTYCDFFVSLDDSFRKRLDAIYYYLGIKTEVMSYEELVKKLRSV